MLCSIFSYGFNHASVPGRWQHPHDPLICWKPQFWAWRLQRTCSVWTVPHPCSSVTKDTHSGQGVTHDSYVLKMKFGEQFSQVGCSHSGKRDYVLGFEKHIRTSTYICLICNVHLGLLWDYTPLDAFELFPRYAWFSAGSHSSTVWEALYLFVSAVSMTCQGLWKDLTSE